MQSCRKPYPWDCACLVETVYGSILPGKVVHVDETRVVVSVGLPDGGSGMTRCSLLSPLSFMMEECPTSWTISWRHSRLRRVGDRVIRSLAIACGLESMEGG